MAEEQGQAPQEQPVDVFGALVAHLQPEFGEDKPRDEKGKFVSKAETPKPEEAKPEAEAETEEGEKPTEETEEEPAQPEVRKHKLTVKSEAGEDEELEVDEEELKRGYMKSKDYSHKTAALKRERESVAAEIKKATEQRQKELDERLEMAEQAIWHTLAPEIQNTDWNKLAEENPAEWAKKYQLVQNVNGRLAQIQAERKKLAETREQEARANYKKQAEEAIETLKADIPGWNQELYGKVLKSGVEHYGFKREEVNAITDSRAIKVLHDAMQYRALKAKPIVEKKVVPAAPKVTKPGAGEKPDQNADQWKQGMDSFRKSGGKWQQGVGLALDLLKREG